MTMAAVFAMAGLVVLNSCSEDEDPPTALTLESLMANDKDLNGATQANDVAVDGVIIATFSTDVDAATASASTVMLTRTFDGSAVDADIAVAGKTVTITPDASFFEGDAYKVSFTTGLKSKQAQALSATVERNFGTVGIGLGTAPKSANQTVYLQFSNEVVDLTGNAEATFEQLSFTADRFGNANSAASFNGGTGAGNGDIVELTGNDFISSSMTISLWVHINAADYVAPGNRALLGLGANQGYMFEIGDYNPAESSGPNWLKWTSNHKVDPDPNSHVTATAWGEYGGDTDGGTKINTLTTTGWHHIVLTNDASTYTKTGYWDGVKIKTFNLLDANGEWNLKDMLLNTGEGIDPKLTLGYFASRANTNPDWAQYANAQRTFKGAMDDLRIFDVALSASEVTNLYNAEKP